MKPEKPEQSGCACNLRAPSLCDEASAPQPFTIEKQNGPSCCGGPAAADDVQYEKPGYRLQGFVSDFHETKNGAVPRIKTRWSLKDHGSTLATRFGIGRNRYRVAPGLYCTGSPDSHSPVLVTANYKLTLDTLRKELTGFDTWIVVLETFGVNVWCAAGKGTFSTDEVIKRVKLTGIDRLVDHGKLILPQLSATGVQARKVKKQTGFEVMWGPVHSRHLPAFLKNGMKAETAMRRVTFSLMERLVLTPIELSHLAKPTLYVVLILFFLSGLGRELFSIGDAVSRGFISFAAYLFAVFSGAVLAPVLLPWLPGRAFSIKGTAIGALTGLMLVGGFWGQLGMLEMVSILLLTLAVSSYLAMNFTGSTPYTSPTGVEKEMRRAIPFQLGGLILAASLWVGAGFKG